MQSPRMKSGWEGCHSRLFESQPKFVCKNILTDPFSIPTFPVTFLWCQLKPLSEFISGNMYSQAGGHITSRFVTAGEPISRYDLEFKSPKSEMGIRLMMPFNATPSWCYFRRMIYQWFGHESDSIFDLCRSLRDQSWWRVPVDRLCMEDLL